MDWKFIMCCFIGGMVLGEITKYFRRYNGKNNNL